jgi:hypothetical protein
MRVGRPRLSSAGEQHSAYAFARNPHEHVILAEPLDPDAEITDAAAVSAALFRSQTSPLRTSTTTTTSASSNNSALRLDPGRARLALFPRNARDLRANALLHDAARSAEFSPADAAAAFGTNVVALAFPAPLAALLAAIDAPHLRAASIELLALVAEDEDDAGREDMQRELEPSVWRDLTARMAVRPSQPAPPHIMQTVEQLLRMCYRTPWYIAVPCLHVAPADIVAALCRQAAGNQPCNENDMATRAGQDHNKIDQTSQATNCTLAQSPSSRETALWDLFQAWHPVRVALVDRLGISGRVAATALLDAESVGEIENAWTRAHVVVAASRASRDTFNVFSMLPHDLVTRTLAPRVLLAGLSVQENCLQIDDVDNAHPESEPFKTE